MMISLKADEIDCFGGVSLKCSFQELRNFLNNFFPSCTGLLALSMVWFSTENNTASKVPCWIDGR